MTLKKQVTAELKTRFMINNQSPALDAQLAIALDVIEKRFERQQTEFNSALQNIQAIMSLLHDCYHYVNADVTETTSLVNQSELRDRLEHAITEICTFYNQSPCTADV